MQVTVITDLYEEPIPLDQVRNWLKVSQSVAGEDEVITSCLKAAREYCERYAGLSFGQKTFEVKTSGYLGADSLPYGPNQTITQVLDSSGVVVDLNTYTGSYLEYLRGFTVQNSYVDEFGWDGIPKGLYAGGYIPNQLTYTVTYTAGYYPGTLPEVAKMAILKLTAELYALRENSVIGTIVADLPTGVKALLDQIKPRVLFV